MGIDYIKKLQDNPYVREKDLGNNIHSFNYSHKAFWNGVWDEQTIKARGLFMNVKSQTVKARAYDKFFAINERPETNFDIIKKNIYLSCGCLS